MYEPPKCPKCKKDMIDVEHEMMAKWTCRKCNTFIQSCIWDRMKKKVKKTDDSARTDCP